MYFLLCNPYGYEVAIVAGVTPFTLLCSWNVTLLLTNCLRRKRGLIMNIARGTPQNIHINWSCFCSANFCNLVDREIFMKEPLKTKILATQMV